MDLSNIVKAYDIRGVVGEQIDAAIVRDLGAALARLLLAEDAATSAVAVGHDMRDSSPALAAAFAEGVTGYGVDVVSIGLASTDMLYYASGTLGLPGAMFTASHNPAKLQRDQAVPGQRRTPIGPGHRPVRDPSRMVETDDVPAYDGPTGGSVSDTDILEQLRRATCAASPPSPVSDRSRSSSTPATAWAAYTVPAVVFDGLPLDDRAALLRARRQRSPTTRPTRSTRPTCVDLQKPRSWPTAPTSGWRFDGDADRCFVVDERGEPVSPSAITGLVAVRELAKSPGSAVIHNLITSRAVPEIVAEHGGRPVRTRVGHSFIKQTMAQTDAVFGGEHSAHYYFRDFWRADSGMLAALHVLAALGEQDGTLSALMAAYERYAASGEINSTVTDQAARRRPSARSTRRGAPSSTSSTGSP